MTADLPPLPRRTTTAWARKLDPAGHPVGPSFAMGGRIHAAAPSTYGGHEIRTPREQVVTIVFHAPDHDVLRILFGIPAGWPLFYRRTWPMLGAAPARLALPWGNSAYTTINVADAATGWAFGPAPNGLTPSSEGPRRLRAVIDQAVRDIRDGTTARRLAEWANDFQPKHRGDQHDH